MTRRLIPTAAILLATVAWPMAAAAQRVEHGRGNIVSIDYNQGTVDLRDPQGRVATWRFDKGSSVKFTDGKSFFPNPSVMDLRAPMYVHYTFSDEVISSFDVVELGFQPGNAESSSQTKQQGRARTVVGRVTAYDPSVRQVEIEHAGRRETFQLTDRSDQQLSPGDRITLRTDWSGQRELVVDVRRTGRGNDPNTESATQSGNTSSTSATADREWAEGRVVRITSRGVVMEVAGSRQTYRVDDSRLLRELRVGDSVEFEWRQDRNGRMYITDVR